MVEGGVRIEGETKAPRWCQSRVVLKILPFIPGERFLHHMGQVLDHIRTILLVLLHLSSYHLLQ
jgi:hypothetical protein